MLSCSVSLMTSIAVDEVWRCWRWWDKGQLGDRFPDGIPLLLCRAIEDLDYGYGVGLAKRFAPKKGKGKGKDDDGTF